MDREGKEKSGTYPLVVPRVKMQSTAPPLNLHGISANLEGITCSCVYWSMLPELFTAVDLILSQRDHSIISSTH